MVEDKYEGFSKEQLIRILHLYEQRCAFQAKRAEALAQQVKDERALWYTYLNDMNNPNMYAIDGQRLHDWLYQMVSATKALFRIENQKYGLGNLWLSEKASPAKREVARILLEFLNYYGIDDE